MSVKSLRGRDGADLGSAPAFLGAVLVLHALVLDPAALDPTAPKGLVLAAGLALAAAVSAAHPALRRPLPRLGRLDLVVATLTLLALVGEWGRAPVDGPLWPAVLLMALTYAAGRWLLAGVGSGTTLRLLGGVTAVVAFVNLGIHVLAPPAWRTTVVLGGGSLDQVAPGLVGTLGNPNLLAAWLLPGLPALAALSRGERGAGAWRLALSLLVLPCLALTWCRSAWLVALPALMLGWERGGDGRTSPRRSAGAGREEPSGRATAGCSAEAGREEPSGRATAGCSAEAGREEPSGRSTPGCSERAPFRGRLLLALGAALVLVVLGLSSGGGWKLFATATASRRFELWSAAVGALAERPLAGWGPGGFERVWTPVAPPGAASGPFVHSLPLQVWGDLGLGGLVALGAGLWLLVGRVRRRAGARGGDGASSGAGTALEAGRDGTGDGLGAAVAALGCLAFLADGLANVGPVTPVAVAWFALTLSLAADGGTSVQRQGLRSAALGILALTCLAILPLLATDWDVARAQHEVRTGPVPAFALEGLAGRLDRRPAWLRGRHDLGGRQAQGGRLAGALRSWALVEGHVPGWQAVRTNRAAVARVLSGDR